MFLSNVPTILRMAFDRRFVRFILELHRDLNPHERLRALGYVKCLKALARGERILRFDGQYILSSFIPPLPSKAFSTFLKASETADASEGVLL